MTRFDMRLGNSEQDKKIDTILTQHDGFTNATAYVKAAILEYHNRHYLSKEMLVTPEDMQSANEQDDNQMSNEERALLDYLMADIS